MPKSKARGRSRLSDTLKSFASLRAVLHLFGNSLEHQIDALLSERWQKEEHRRRMLRRVPGYLHARVDELLTLAAEHRDTLREVLEEALDVAGFIRSNEGTTEAFTVRDMEKGRLGPGNGHLIQNLIFAGEPLKRSWQVANEEGWVSFLSQELEYRANYVTADRHHRHKRELWNIYFRLPPWVAMVANQELDTRDGAAVLGEVGIELAETFGVEFGVDPVGIAFHRENKRDLHMHLVYTPSREVLVPKDVSEYRLRKLAKELALRMREEALKKGEKPPGRNTLLKAAREEIERTGQGRFETVELHRGRYPRPMQILGPSFRFKMQLWRASGWNPHIAAWGDRPETEANTFEKVVVERVKRGEDLRKTFADVWGEDLLETRVREILGPEHADLFREYEAEAVGSYLKYGSVVPGLEEYIASKIRELEQSLPENVQQDLKKREEALYAREKAVRKKERELKGALILTDEVCAEFGLQNTRDAKAAYRRLLHEKRRAEQRLQAAIDYIKSRLREGAEKLGEAVWALLESLLRILESPKTQKKKEHVIDGPEGP